MSKTATIAFRTKQEMKARLAACAETVRLNESQLAEACVEALVEYIEKNGEIRLPLAVVPKASLRAADTPHSERSSGVARISDRPGAGEQRKSA